MRRIVPDHQALVYRAVWLVRGRRTNAMVLARAFLICGAALVSLAACTTQSGSMSVQGKPVSGYVEMTQVQAAYLGSGNAVNGFRGTEGILTHSASAGSASEGSAFPRSRRRGEVYGLERLRDFPGAYVQGRYGLALGTVSTGDLWLKNGKWCDHASSGKATRTDAESGRRRSRNSNEPVIPMAGSCSHTMLSKINVS